MKKSTIKTYLILLLVFLLSISVMLTAFACNSTEEEPAAVEEETDTEFTSLISNGNFSTYSSDTAQPYSVSNWSTYTPSGYSDENKVAGIIDTGSDYDSNRSTWGDLANPYGTVTPNKVLMIYNKEENVYGYTNTFTSTASAYYSISVKVKVEIGDADKGASFRVYTENGYAEFDKINGTDAFTTYTIYMQAPCDESSTITVRLSLGRDDKKVKGYAFFDDVIATKISEKDYNAAAESTTVKKVSMLYPEGEFNYYSYNSSSTALQTSPMSWSWSSGANIAGKALPSGDRYTGIISTAESVWETVAETYGDNPGTPVAGGDDYVLMMIKKQTSDAYSPTAGYYESKKKINIDRATLYEISVWVKAIVSENSDDKKGARVVLKGTDEYESDLINTTGQAENNGWAKVTFYILGNQFRSEDFSIQLWIGNDKANDTLVQGQVFYDKLEIKKIKTVDATEHDAVITEYEDKDRFGYEDGHIASISFVNLETNEAEKMIINEQFGNIGSTLEMGAVSDVKVKDGDVIATVIPREDFDNEQTNWKEKYGIDENPLYPYSFAPVLIVNNTIPSAYEVKTVNPLREDGMYEIKQSLSYRISVWIKTIGLDEGKNVTLSLVDKEDNTIESFSVNTVDYDNDATNNYVEYAFYLTGELPTAADGSESSNYVRITIKNGSGSQFDPASYQKGAFLIANINMEQITYTDYDSHSSSGTYSKAKDYTSNDGTITNGNFNTYDRKETTFDAHGYVDMTDKDGNTELVGALPSSWTNNVTNNYGITKVGGEELPTTYHISKVAEGDNPNKEFTAAIQGKAITTIHVTGPNDFDKTYNSETEWGKVFDINTITGKVTWKSGNEMEVGDYDVKIKVDEKELNNLIAGIINVNATPDYLNQFGLSKAIIYDKWADSANDATKAKNITFGAPNLLMITTRSTVDYITLKNTVVNGETTKDMTEKAAIKSPSVSLSANSYYHFRCYAKALNGAKGQVYVTTTSTDTKVTSFPVTDENGWVEYNFYVETGLSSVSAQFEIYYGEKGDDGESHYGGTLLFDSFSYVSMTEEEYLATPVTDRALFSTITFDTSSASETAVSPSGFSATNSGAVNSDTQVSGIIAKGHFAYKDSDGKKDKLGIYTTVTKEEDGQTTTEDVLKENSALSESYIFDDIGMPEGTEVGDYLLMINNRKSTYQSYYKSSLSLASDSYYRFSAYVRTAMIEKGSYAKVYVSIADEPTTFEINTEYDKDGNAIENKWQKITFYYKNERDSSVSASLYFELGQNTDDGKMRGYFFIDNVSLEKITEKDYTDENKKSEIYETDEGGNEILDENGNKILTAESVAYRLANKFTVLEKIETTDNENGDDGDEDDNDEDESTGLNTTLLWTYITSIAIAVVLIAVIVVWLIKKYRRPKTVTADKKATYDRTNTKSGDDDEPEQKTGSARDEFKD